MSRFLTLLAFLSLTITVTAQTNGTIKGRIVDSVAKQSLKDASITILEAKDSTVDVFGLAKQDGNFSISNVSFGNMLVQIRFQGYEVITRQVTLSKTNANIDLGIIYMKQAANDLGTVTVTQSAIQIRNDTTEFTASAFKTKPNAVAEDLLKKLPGIEVAKDGSVKAHGEQVQRILVDGKRFFGDDPKMATKNLPPDVIDKIQVFDDLSDQSKFTGFDDGNRVKTINITTRKDKRKGYFGKTVAGIGTDDMYDESLNMHRFNGDQQISLLGQANDVNKQNFSPRDIFGGGGGRGGGGGGFGGGGSNNSGITTTLAAGLNYRDAWSKDVDVYGSYFYNNLRTDINQQSFATNIIPNSPDSSVYNDRAQSSVSRTPNHRINFNIEEKIDSSNSFIFRPNISLQTSTPTSSASTITTGGNNKVLINQSINNTHSANSGFNINGANFQFRHRFAKRFRTTSLDLNFSANENNGDGYNYAVNSFYIPVRRIDTINQHYVDTVHAHTFSPTFSYTEPIGKNQILELRYNYTYNKSTSINNTYRFSEIGHGYTQFDSLFSNSYQYSSSSSNVNLSYRLQKTKFNLNIGSGAQYTDLTSNNTTKNVIVSRNYVNFTPTVNFMYNYSKTKSLRLFYNGRTGQPSTSQLQPVTTTSDSINFQIGNPDLKPQFTHSLRLLYTSFDPATSRVLFASINGSMIVNDIQSAVTNNRNGGKVTRYVNLNGTYNLSGYFNYGFPIKKPKSNMNLQTNINYSQYQSLINSESNYTHNTNISETIKWTTNLKNNFDMNLSASMAYNPISNTISSAASQNTNYITQTLAADFTLYSNNGWILASDFDYTHYGNRSPGYNTTVMLITPSVAKQFLKNKAGEIRLSCFDLLNQNAVVSSAPSATQIVDTKTNTLKRYFMLTFTYNLRNFAGQQQRNQENNMFRKMFREGEGGGRPPGGPPGGGFGDMRKGGDN